MSTAVKISNISASISFASNAADLSLSITAAIPFNPFFVLITGIPPPPTAITIFPLRSNSEITFFSIIAFGIGDGTTLLNPRPESSIN